MNVPSAYSAVGDGRVQHVLFASILNSFLQIGNFVVEWTGSFKVVDEHHTLDGGGHQQCNIDNGYALW